MDDYQKRMRQLSEEFEGRLRLSLNDSNVSSTVNNSVRSTPAARAPPSRADTRGASPVGIIRSGNTLTRSVSFEHQQLPSKERARSPLGSRAGNPILSPRSVAAPKVLIPRLPLSDRSKSPNSQRYASPTQRKPTPTRDRAMPPAPTIPKMTRSGSGMSHTSQTSVKSNISQSKGPAKSVNPAPRTKSLLLSPREIRLDKSYF